MANITGLLLAAGASARFGAHKLTASLAGQAMVLHAARALSPCDRILVVVREGDDELHALLQVAGLSTVINERARHGMGSSIACGVNASRDSDGWCLLPADMPRVSMDTTRQIVHALRQGAPLVAPYYQHRRGHPVGFNQGFAASLTALQGEIGARSLVQQHHDKLWRIETDDAGVVVDVDTMQELALLEQALV